jgi:hypothetical protein
MGIETSDEYFNNNNIDSLSGSSGVDLEKDMGFITIIIIIIITYQYYVLRRRRKSQVPDGK